MTNRYLAQDVRDFVVTKLDSEFNTMIGTINTERTHTAPDTKLVTYKWGNWQYPFLMVDIDESEVQYDDDATPLTLNYTTLPEVFTLFVVGFIKKYNDNIYNDIEDWIEAVIRVLHNYNDANISWIAYTKTERAEIYDKENKILKSFVVEFECRVN